MRATHPALSAYAFLVAGAAAIGLYWSLPAGIAATALYSAIGAAAALALLLAAHRIGGPQAKHWRIFGAGIGLMVAGDTVFFVFELEGWSTTTPSVADWFYLVAYPVLAAGFVSLLRRVGVEGRKDRLIDSAIVALGLSAILWGPYFSNFSKQTDASLAGRLTLAAYPTWDLILLALAVGLVLTRSLGGRWAQLLVLAVVLLLAADLVWAIAPDSYSAGDWMDRVWLLSYVTWAAAGLHPSAAKPATVRASYSPAGWQRVAILAVPVVAAPVDFTVDALQGKPFTVTDGVIGTALVLAVLFRLAGTLRRLDATSGTLVERNEQLAESEERFSRTFAHAAVGMALVDERGIIITANERFARMLGRRAADLVGTHGLDLIHPEERDAVSARWSGEFAGTHVDAVQRRLVHAEGHEVWALVGVSVIPGRLAVISCQDITALKRYEESLREADRQKDELISVVSHDLRTPLTSIIGYLELALEAEDDPVLAAELPDFLRVSMRNAQRLSRLVEELLFVSRANAGRAELKLARVEVLDVVREVVESERPAADAKRISLAVSGSSQLATADAHRLAEAIENILSNAIKFTPDGGSVRLEVGADAAFVTVRVRDSGPGIAAGDLPHVFERFYRSASSEGVPGDGLGLAIVKAIAGAHGGSVSAATLPDGGAEFELFIPRAARSVLRAA